MTAETSTNISSISGTNITTISGNESKSGASKSQLPSTSQSVQKRATSSSGLAKNGDEIEVQVSDQNAASPTALNKVSATN